MPLMSCEINILLTRSDKCIIATVDYGEREPEFAITDNFIFQS